MPLTLGQQLFEYHIQHILGQGAFGTVYLAHDSLLDRPVAIKELLLAARTDENAFQRFLQEARTAGNLNHPHIVTIHALRSEGENIYLVMEYLPGGTLRSHLQTHAPLPVMEAARIAAEVCKGLAAAHAKGIVHRDVKPENILLTEDGHAKIGDFGIAHVPHAMGGYTLTRTGFQPGTLLYMSPEQIRGHPVDGRSDVYQIGTLLYEMLTGRHYVDLEALQQRAQETAGPNVMLFQARLCELLAETICNSGPPGLRDVRPDVPPWLENLLAVALAKHPEERPSAEALAKALQGAGEAPLARAHEDTATPDTGRTRGQSTAPHRYLGALGALGSTLTRAARRLRHRPAATETAEPKDDAAYIQRGRRNETTRERQAALHLNLGVAYRQQGRLDKAIREYHAALRINPNDAKAHYNLGSAYDHQGRLDEAIREFRAALRINPNYAEAHFGLGLDYMERGRLDEAIQELHAALRINPNLAEAHLYLGAAYDHQGRLDRAIQEYHAALRINPNLAEAHFGLGAAYGQQGRLDEAIQEFQAAAQLGSREARTLLSQMGLR